MMLENAFFLFLHFQQLGPYLKLAHSKLIENDTLCVANLKKKLRVVSDLLQRQSEVNTLSLLKNADILATSFLLVNNAGQCTTW